MEMKYNDETSMYNEFQRYIGEKNGKLGLIILQILSSIHFSRSILLSQLFLRNLFIVYLNVRIRLHGLKYRFLELKDQSKGEFDVVEITCNRREFSWFHFYRINDQKFQFLQRHSVSYENNFYIMLWIYKNYWNMGI